MIPAAWPPHRSIRQQLRGAKGLPCGEPRARGHAAEFPVPPPPPQAPAGGGRCRGGRSAAADRARDAAEVGAHRGDLTPGGVESEHVQHACTKRERGELRVLDHRRVLAPIHPATSTTHEPPRRLQRNPPQRPEPVPGRLPNDSGRSPPPAPGPTHLHGLGRPRLDEDIQQLIVRLASEIPAGATNASKANWSGLVCRRRPRDPLNPAGSNTNTGKLHERISVPHGVHNGPALAGHGAQAVRDAIASAITALQAAAAPLPDLGSGRGDGPARPSARPGGAGRLLLRPAQPLAARHQREHQRPAAAVLSQGHRPEPAHPGRPRRGRSRPRKTLGWKTPPRP
jgi:hypothetical protein